MTRLTPTAIAFFVHVDQATIEQTLGDLTITPPAGRDMAVQMQLKLNDDAYVELYIVVRTPEMLPKVVVSPMLKGRSTDV